MALLEPMSLLRHSRTPVPGLVDTTEVFAYTSSQASVCFHKRTRRLILSPPDADVLHLLQELQELANAQEAEERAWLLERLAKRPY